MGWIKVHRSLLDKPIWLNSIPEHKSVLITILMLANHEEKQWDWGGQKFNINPGQFITSLGTIKNRTGKGITMQNVRGALHRFEKLEFLTNESTTIGRLITITNWDSYQYNQNETNKETNKRLTNDQQTTNKRLTPTKNIKERKEFKEGKKCLFKNSNISIQDIQNAFLKTDDIKTADARYYYNSMMDWSESNKQMKSDWIATARAWARKDLAKGELKLKKYGKYPPINF